MVKILGGNKCKPYIFRVIKSSVGEHKPILWECQILNTLKYSKGA
jgi:hypothetical protein